jgi:hypothetical protein
VHKGVLDIADPGRNISKHKRSYLASPLHVASFLFLKRRFVFRGSHPGKAFVESLAKLRVRRTSDRA